MEFLIEPRSSKRKLYFGALRSAGHEDKNDYENYKAGSLESFSEDRLEQMEILSVLERLGFPMDEMGTYFFKDIIVKAMRYLNGTDTWNGDISEDELLQQLKTPFSPFYSELARNELDVGTTTFHLHVEAALKRVDCQQADTNLLFEIYGNFSEETDYGEHALIIGKHMKKARKVDTGYQYTLVSPANIQTGV